MAENTNSTCPYCGGSLLPEEGGNRCRFCKSFFPFDAEGADGQDASNQLSDMKQQVIDQPENAADKELTDEDKAFARKRSTHEFVGIAAAFVSCIFLTLSKTMKMPILMLPGFVCWAFAAAYTAFQVYRAKKIGKKAAWVRVAGLCLLAILMLLFIKPVN